MKIQKVKIGQINPAAYNPRLDLKPDDPEYKKLKRSMDTFGYVEPLVWNVRTGNLVGGHQRFKILLEQGAKEVEVSVVDLGPNEEKALNIALNKISGDWDKEKLGELLEELSKTPDFDFTLSGFDIPERDEILDQLLEPREDNFNFESAVKNEEESITQVGDIIELGEHRILCGNASNPEDLAKLLGKEEVGLIHTDPPYNVNYYGGAMPHDKARPKKSKLWPTIYNDNMSQEDYKAWLKNIITNASKYLALGAAVYIWNGSRQFGPMYDMLTELDFHIGCVITWAKQNFSISRGDYNQQTEFCLYGWKEKQGAHKWYGPNNESTLWEIKRDPTSEYIHPTQKPVALAHRAIRNSSKRGDIILDLFLGSGTTLMAAESLRRRCFGTEISRAYCDGIIKRYAQFAGKDKVSQEVLEKYGIS